MSDESTTFAQIPFKCNVLNLILALLGNSSSIKKVLHGQLRYLAN